MSTILIIFLVIGAIALFIALVIGMMSHGGIAIYQFPYLVDSLVMINEQWSYIDIQLRRRYELIPHLITLLQNHSFRETEILKEVTECAAQSSKATHTADIGTADKRLSHALNNLFAIIANNYPKLQAHEEYLKLHHELTTIEHNIQKSRHQYNRLVQTYNRLISSFLISNIARRNNLHKKDLF
jgi:LemA protein